MFAIVLSILFIIAGVVSSFVIKKSWLSFVGIILAFVIIIVSCIAVVPTGYTSVSA